MSDNLNSWIKRFSALILAGGTLFSAESFCLARALTPPEGLQFHGFASQAYIRSSANNFFGESENGSFDFRELGLNASLRPRPDLMLSAQLLSRHAGKKDRENLRLDYALLDYAPVSGESRTFGLRIGRIKTPLGLYNDTRDVAFTRPSILLPQSIYFDRTRNLALSADGINFYADLRTTSGDFFYQLELVYLEEVDDEQSVAALLPKSTQSLGTLEKELSYVSRLIYERDGGRIRLGLSAVFLNIGFDTTDPSAQDGSIRFQPVILSAQYNAEFWTLTSEYAFRHFKYRDVGVIPGLSNFSTTGESYYLQGSYRLAEKLEALLRYDVLYQDRDDRMGAAFSAQFGVPRHSRFAKDWTFGLRWDLSKAWMSRIEYHRVDGTAWLPRLDNPVPASELKRHWTMWAFLISYRF